MQTTLGYGSPANSGNRSLLPEAEGDSHMAQSAGAARAATEKRALAAANAGNKSEGIRIALQGGIEVKEAAALIGVPYGMAYGVAGRADLLPNRTPRQPKAATPAKATKSTAKATTTKAAPAKATTGKTSATKAAAAKVAGSSRRPATKAKATAKA